MKTLCGIPFLIVVGCFWASRVTAQKPNIVILYADDMGYGDLGSQNKNSKIPTPHLDQLAAEGMRFTNAHSSSGICTPSRYALLTGRYHWRKFHDIVDSWEASVFGKTELTMPEMLLQNGYRTACVGKWHLGWNWPAIRKADAKPVTVNNKKTWTPEAFDWTKPIPDGPTAHGFNYYFGDDVPNFPPYTWLQNDRVLAAPDVMLDITGKTLEGNWEARPGPARQGWDFYAVMPTNTKKAVEWIKEQKKDSPARPFFLYFAWPGLVKPGTVSAGLISQIDLMATLTDFLKIKLPEAAAEDSFSQLQLWRGKAPSARPSMVHNTYDKYAIQRDNWVYIDAKDGEHSKMPDWFRTREKYPAADASEGLLYDLSKDIAQRENLLSKYPAKAEALRAELRQIRRIN